VATWAEFEREAPDLAAVAAMLWPGIHALHRGERLATPQSLFDVAYLATVRRDGSPRLHPFCPVLAAGSLYAAVPRASPKGNDLRRDPRCVIHATPGPADDELCIRANAMEVSDDEARRAAVVAIGAASAVGGMIETMSNDPLFEFDLVRVDVARWVDIGQPRTRAERSTYIPES
jgi:Pyridoxamine 5'-phosphate oxidase